VSETPQFQVVVKDPPMLSAMLLCAQDPEIAAEISRAYYGCLEGRKASPFVMSSVLLSAIGNAILTELAAIRKGSGSRPVQPEVKAPSQADFKSFQAEVLKALRERGGDQPKTSPLETPKAPVSTESKTTTKRPWLWAIIGIATVLALFGAGYLTCWMHERQVSDERVKRVIDAQSSDVRTFLDYVSMGGRMARGPIKPFPGISEKEGFAMSSTGGRLSVPWISADDEAIIPIK
jgi:hypothetical protein